MTDETAIREVFESFKKSWDPPGIPGFEALFTADADFIVITGRWLEGRDEIVRYHRELLQSVYTGSRTLPTSHLSLRQAMRRVLIASGAYPASRLIP